ncbi:protoporphyrinogen/coproporphyrinogen oxidase [Glaciibacter superstes]|uniref:protoporphyrinogen/coproporphyrinogen oxidase n=1 Tax=Glaciibacter superstes TaxID=501023 RepID=UPI0003B79CBD|nr:FAD-dependent oxidoreductase [Glaciibacter superstes]
MSDVIVIGGGIAGLVAARECAHLGLKVTVYEATDAVGGAVAAHEVAGLTLDAGAESFAVRKGAVADFVAGLGLADEIVAPNPAGAWLLLPGTSAGPANPPISVPLPKTGVLGIPGSPLADDVRRVIGWRGAWRAYADRLIPVLKIGREHNLGELVQKRMGRRVLERLVEPVAGGVYSAPASDLEVDVVAPGLNAALTTTGSLSGAVLAMRSSAPAGSAVGGLRGGMSRLVSALIADLEHYGAQIVTGAMVTALSRTDAAADPATDETETDASATARRWRVTVSHAVAPDDASQDQDQDASQPPTSQPPTSLSPTPQSDDGTHNVESRFVIVAAPGAAAIGLLAPLGAELAVTAALNWPSPTAVELATLVLDAPALDSHPRGTGVLVAEGATGVTAKALTHVSAKWDWVAEAAGPGRHVIRLSYGRAGERSRTQQLSDAEFQALALHDASVILGTEPGASAVVGFARTPWNNALSPATLGARDRGRAVEEAVAAEDGLEVTGAWLAGTGLASVIPHALAAASRVRHASLLI